MRLHLDEMYRTNRNPLYNRLPLADKHEMAYVAGFNLDANTLARRDS